MFAPQMSCRSNPRGRVRTWVFSLATLLVLGGIIPFVLIKSLSSPEPAITPAPEMAPGTSSSAPAIAGTVTVAKELEKRLPEEGTLFVIARKTAGPPFAVARIPRPRFPQAFRLGPENVMVAGTPFEGTVHLSARLSRSGTAGPAQAGDLEGENPESVPIGASNAPVPLTRIH